MPQKAQESGISIQIFVRKNLLNAAQRMMILNYAVKRRIMIPRNATHVHSAKTKFHSTGSTDQTLEPCRMT
jgi:hypothetical protein